CMMHQPVDRFLKREALLRERKAGVKPILSVWKRRLGRSWLHQVWKIHVQGFLKNNRSLQLVRQLTDISRPPIFQQPFPSNLSHSLLRQPMPPTKPTNEQLRNSDNILRPIPQRGYGQPVNVQPMEQIFPELPG